MRKQIIIYAGMLMALLSCRNQQKIEIARLHEGQNSGIVFTFDTNRLLRLAAEDLLIDQNKSNLLITPGSVYSIEPALTDTETVKSFIKPKFPENTSFAITLSSSILKNQLGKDSVAQIRFMVIADAEPDELTELQPMEINTKSLGIQEIGGDWWLEARGQYQNKNSVVFYRLYKSGHTLYLRRKARSGQKNMIVCSQRYDSVVCTPVLTEDLICRCEGYPPPKGSSGTDVDFRFSDGLNSIHGLGRLLKP